MMRQRWRTPAYIFSAVAGWMTIHELLKVYWRRVARLRLQAIISPPESVRTTSAAVMGAAEHVEVSTVAINQLVSSLTPGDLERMMAPTAFDSSIHFVDGTWRTAQYLLLVDALNFCFWPSAPPSLSPGMHGRQSCFLDVSLAARSVPPGG